MIFQYLQDFEELISFAAAGDSRKVDITGGDLKTKDEGDIYSTIPDDMLIYCFGKGTNGGKLIIDVLVDFIYISLTLTLKENFPSMSQQEHSNFNACLIS